MDLTNWKLKGCGAYFAYVEYPFDVPSDTLCKQLLSSKVTYILSANLVRKRIESPIKDASIRF